MRVNLELGQTRREKQKNVSALVSEIPRGPGGAVRRGRDELARQQLEARLLRDYNRPCPIDQMEIVDMVALAKKNVSVLK